MGTIWQATLTALNTGQVCQNVLHFNNVSGNLTGLQVATDLRDNFIQTYLPFQHNGVQWVDIEVRDVDQPAIAATHLTVNILGSGAGQTQGDDPCRCRVFQLKTSFSGPRGHGRFYGIGTPLATWINGVVGTASLNAGQTLVNQWKAHYVTNVPSTGLLMVIGPRSTPHNWKSVVDIVQRPIAGFQRRRNIGVGI
jgi:hypothetical protein